MKKLFTFLTTLLLLFVVTPRAMADDVYWMLGNLANDPGYWGTNNTDFSAAKIDANKFVNDNGVYSFTYQCTETKTYYFKVVTNYSELCLLVPSYDKKALTTDYDAVSYSNNGGNATYAWAINMTAGNTYVIYLDNKSRQIKYAVQTDDVYWMLGNLANDPGYWGTNNTDFSAAKIDANKFVNDNGVYSFTYQCTETKTYYFKVVTNYSELCLLVPSYDKKALTTDYDAVSYSNNGGNATYAWAIDMTAGNTYVIYLDNNSRKIKYAVQEARKFVLFKNGDTEGVSSTDGKYVVDLTQGNSVATSLSFSIDDTTYGLSADETLGEEVASKEYTFQAGGTGKLTLATGYKYTLSISEAGVLTVTAKKKGEVVASDGYYLVGNFFNTDDKDAINYDRRYFKFSMIAENTYQVEIPASITAYAQILGTSASGNEVCYGPNEANYGISKTWPEDIQGADGKMGGSLTDNPLVEAPQFVAGSSSNKNWLFTTRNQENTDTSDGLYKVIMKTDGDGVPSTWTITHDPYNRIAYFKNSDENATAVALHNVRNEATGAFDNKFLGSINMRSGQTYYVISNVIKDNELIWRTANEYGTVKCEKSGNATTNKLFLQGNGGLSFKDTDPENLLYPNEGAVVANVSYEGTYVVEYNPSRGDFGKANTDTHLGFCGDLQIRNGGAFEPIKSVSLVGPSFPETMNGDDWKWDASDYDMEYSDEENCYMLTIKTSDVQGKCFRFVGNHKSSINWYEDDIKARIPYDGDGEGSRAIGSDPNKVNYSLYTDDGLVEDNHILWNRPAGTWTVRFYIVTKTTNGGNPTMDYYYTITGNRTLEMRDYADVKYNNNTRTIQGIGNYKYFCTWSDTKNWKRPTNVEAYVVSEIEAATADKPAQVKLTKVDEEYLPKNIGMVLVAKDKSENGNVITRDNANNTTTFNVLSEPLEEYDDQDVSYTATSLLKPMVVSDYVPKQNEEDGSYNYLFGFYKRLLVYKDETDASQFLLGFWLSKGTKKNYANSAYLNLTKVQVGDYRIGSSYENMGNIVLNAKMAPAVLFSLDANGGATTGIKEVKAADAKASDAYYTVSGIAVSKPSQKGVYVHKGKKYIVK